MTKIPASPRKERCLTFALKFIVDEEIGWLPVGSLKLAEKYACSVHTVGELSSVLDIDRNNIISGKDADVFFYNNQYKIIFNELMSSHERMNWTIMHEIAHIYLGHLVEFGETGLLRETLSDREYNVLEREADIFTSEVLAPKIVLNKMNIRYYKYVQKLCNISEVAAKLRIEEIKSTRYNPLYSKWQPNILEQFKRYLSVVVPNTFP